MINANFHSPASQKVHLTGGWTRRRWGWKSNPSSGLTRPPNPFCSSPRVDRRDRRARRNRKPVTQNRTLNTSHTYLLMNLWGEGGGQLKRDGGPNVRSRTNEWGKETNVGKPLLQMFGGISGFKCNIVRRLTLFVVRRTVWEALKERRISSNWLMIQKKCQKQNKIKKSYCCLLVTFDLLGHQFLF